MDPEKLRREREELEMHKKRGMYIIGVIATRFGCVLNMSGGEQRRLGCKQKRKLQKMHGSELKMKLQLKRKGEGSSREKHSEKRCSR